MIAFAIKALGYLKLVPKPVWYALCILAALLILWHIHSGWERKAYNDAYNAGWAKQKVLTDREVQKNAVNLASINTLQSALADKNAESEARAKAFADAKAADAATLAEMDRRQKANASRLETLQRLARDLPENPSCRAPAALLANLEGL